jgi:hypothetical protein
MRSFSIANGRFCTKVWMEPTYSPMMPRQSSCTEPRKTRRSRLGAELHSYCKGKRRSTGADGLSALRQLVATEMVMNIE